jgi:ADP-ribosyl-[dinitrogen reductase] hydrolase
MEITERMKGGLWGLLVADAVGVPYEFHEPKQLPALTLLEPTPPPTFARAHLGTPVGTWSDDGAQALALWASLRACGGWQPSDFAGRLLAWQQQGHYTPDGRVFDIGIQTAKALARLAAGVPPLQAGSREQYSQGNGSLMRVLPLALWHWQEQQQGNDGELVFLAHQQSQITHGHPMAQVCCALYCLWAQQLLAGASDGWDQAVLRLGELYADHHHFAPEYQQTLLDLQPQYPRTPKGSGYVVDCLFSAKFALAQGNYEAVVKAAIALGHDTDTTACVAGGLAGIRDGFGAIPQRWLAVMQGKDLVVID